MLDSLTLAVLLKLVAWLFIFSSIVSTLCLVSLVGILRLLYCIWRDKPSAWDFQNAPWRERPHYG